MQSETVANEPATRLDTEAASHELASSARGPRRTLLSHLAAVGLGVTAMYFLDPQRGRRRRQLVRDKLIHAAKATGEALGPNRAGGLAAVAPVRGVRPAVDQRRTITVRKSVRIAAPIHEVFTWVVAWERWPYWMSHVLEVRSHGGSGTVGERTHWVVGGPGGTVEWDAETTRFVPPSLVAWRTVEGSPVAHVGTIQLSRAGGASTRLDVSLSYTTAAGAAGHAIATLFRRNPKHQLQGDLVRLKTTIETGRPPQDAAVRDGTAGVFPASSDHTTV